MPERPPNLILIVTDQQRAPQHWPDDPGWLDALMPNDAELRRTGMAFSQAFIASAMCSPSRASIFTGRYPARHGVTLTMTHGDLHPDPRNFPSVLRTAGRLARSGEVPRGHLARQFTRGLLRLGPKAGSEPQLSPGIPTLGTLLRERGYHVALKGKWHVTKGADAATLERDFGFSDWEPTDAGGDVKATNFGGGRAGTSGEGWDEDYTRQVERWLGRADLPEPFCLVWCRVNPHDVLGYPSSFADGGYTLEELADLDVPLPRTIDEDLRTKPTVQAMTKVGQASYLGTLGGREAERMYARFYAHLHRVVDAKIGRLVDLLGSPEDPASLRSRTVVVRTSDHGELGLSHGGLRQKMFNAYEEAIHVPLVVSHPGMFPAPVASDALVAVVPPAPPGLRTACAAARPPARTRARAAGACARPPARSPTCARGRRACPPGWSPRRDPSAGRTARTRARRAPTGRGRPRTSSARRGRSGSGSAGRARPGARCRPGGRRR
jgi:arylsulfatase A-like enzyme